MHPTQEKWDQRRAYRVGAPGASAVCRGASFVARYEVSNLSTTGVLLTAGASRPIGEPVDLELTTPDRGALQTHGHISRAEEGTIAIAFDELEPSGEDTVHDIVLDTLELAVLA